MRFLPPNVVQFNSKHLSDLTYNMKTEVYYWISVQPKGSKISEPASTKTSDQFKWRHDRFFNCEVEQTSQRMPPD